MFTNLHLFEKPSVPPWNKTKNIIDMTLRTYNKKITSPEVIKSHFLSLIHHYSPQCQIFTDESKDQNAAGCAFVIPDEQIIKMTRLDPISNMFTNLFL